MTASSATTIKKNEELINESGAFTAYDMYKEAYKEIKDIEAKIAALKVAKAALEAPIRADMEALKITKMVDESNATMFTLTKSVRNTLDSKRFKETYPELSKEFNKTTNVTTFKVM